MHHTSLSARTLSLSPTLFAAAALGLAACGSPTGPEPPSALLAAPQSVRVDGVTLTVAAGSLSRIEDCCEDPGDQMTGGLNLATTTGVPVPATVTVDQFWAVNGTLVWSTAPESTSRTGSGGSELNVTVIDGPPWDAGSSCDLIVRVHGGDGSVQLLRISGVVIIAIV